MALKIGASSTGSRAARSHTGALAGRHDAWQAWARAAGVIEVAELDHLVETAAHLARGPALAGPRMAMVTSSGGVAVLLADALEPRGFAFAPLDEDTVRRVEGLLPSYVTVTNPLDITAGLPDETFGEVLATVGRDPRIDVVVVPLTMASAGRGSTRAAEVARAARRVDEAARGVLARRGSSSARASGCWTRRACRSSPRSRAARRRWAPPSRSGPSEPGRRGARRRCPG